MVRVEIPFFSGSISIARGPGYGGWTSVRRLVSRRQRKPAPIPPAEPAPPPCNFKARSEQQARIFSAYDKNDILFLIGPADTGKSFSACLKAYREVLAGTKDRIVVYRPAVDAGEDLGHLPGSYEEKLASWVEPLVDSFTKIAGKNNHRLREVLEMKSLGRSRGLTFERTVVIVTEAQNCTGKQLKLILTRLGLGSRLVIEGDMSQCDLPKGRSGLLSAIEKIKHLPGVGVMKLVEEPAGTPNSRHPLVKMITACWPD